MSSDGRTRRIADAVLGFLLGQGALQVINVGIGLYLVHCLSIDDYAKFGLATGFQVSGSILMDFGSASTVIPLVGDRKSDRAVVGRYVRGAKSLRDLSFWIISPFVALTFIVITYRQGWAWPTQMALLASVLVSLYSSGSVSYHSAPFYLYRRLREYYVPQVIAAACRLGAYLAFNVLGALNSWTAAGCNAVNIATNGYLLGRKSRSAIDWPEHDDPAIRREMRRFVLPAVPAILLGAFHGQIALFLVSLFGDAMTIAEVAALGRIGQLFNVLMTFNIVLVEPYIAHLPRQKVLLTYVRLIALAALGCSAMVLLAYVAPGIFLWILGPKYDGLRGLFWWVVLTACVNYIAGLIWIMNRSRKWVFWRGTITEIALVIVVQTAFTFMFGMRSTQNAVMFNFASSFCYVIAHSYVAVHGFLKDHREMARSP
jgi:hypothetical protein